MRENGVPEEMKKAATLKRRRPTMRPTRGMAVVVTGQDALYSTEGEK
jgi:hypothetical protein